jgi:hypothetical protein
MKCGGSSGTDDGYFAEWLPKSPLGTKVSSMVETGSVLMDSSICKRPVGLKVSVCTSAMARDNLNSILDSETRLSISNY